MSQSRQMDALCAEIRAEQSHVKLHEAICRKERQASQNTLDARKVPATKCKVAAQGAESQISQHIWQ